MPTPSFDLAAAIADLRRPFTAEALKWKVQVNPKGSSGKALLVCYIDARLAAERLNNVCPGEWSDAYVAVPGGMMCELTVAGITRRDVGWSKGTGNDMDLKALYSDAFKRAAVKFGVGVSIYALPKAFLPASDLRQGGSTWFLTDKAERKLADSYNRWLASEAAQVFGAVLDHGDVEGAQGDVDADEHVVRNAGAEPASPARSRGSKSAPAPEEATPEQHPAPEPEVKPEASTLTREERAELVELYRGAGWDQQTLCLQLVAVDAIPSDDVSALGDNPSADQYADLIAPAMRSLTREQFATVKSALEDEVAKREAA